MVKINLLYGADDILSGYINVDPTTSSQDNKKVSGDVVNLDYLVENSECNHIVANEILSYLPASLINQTISHWIAKLRHKGILTIVDVDLIEISKGISQRYIDLEAANNLLYGAQDTDWKFKKCALSSFDIIEYLKEHKLRILKNRINNYKFTIEAQRI